MTCPDCLGKRFERGQYEYTTVTSEQGALLFENVPAERCTQCGYLVVSDVVARALDRVLAERQPDGYAMVPVYDLSRQAAKSGISFASTLPRSREFKPPRG